MLNCGRHVRCFLCPTTVRCLLLPCAIRLLTRFLLFLGMCRTYPVRYMAYLTNWGMWSTILHFGLSSSLGWWALVTFTRRRLARRIDMPAAAAATVDLTSPRRPIVHLLRAAHIIFEIA